VTDNGVHKGFWWRVIVAIVKPTLLVFTKRDWRGSENMPRTGGIIVAANHVSHVDPLTLGHFMHEHGRVPRYLGKASLFKIPVFGRIITSAGQIPVHRGSSEAAHAFEAAVEAVERGESVIFYPEGTITKDPQMWPMTGKTGAARVALTTGRPVIPVAQWGPQEIYAAYSHKIRLLPRKTMRMKAGPPVDLSAYEGKPLTADLLQKATVTIMQAIAEGVGELRGETPPAELYDPRTAKADEKENQKGVSDEKGAEG
jgi:1-acyl-sn-glycerol-3-phosphate acyltransferase